MAIPPTSRVPDHATPWRKLRCSNSSPAPTAIQVVAWKSPSNKVLTTRFGTLSGGYRRWSTCGATGGFGATRCRLRTRRGRCRATRPARVAAESSPRAPRHRGGPIGSRSAAHGARREEQDDQHTQTSQQDRDPHPEDPPVARHGPATLVHRSWHGCKGRRAGRRLYGRPFGGGAGRSGFRRQCMGCGGGDPSVSRPCPVPPLDCPKHHADQPCTQDVRDLMPAPAVFHVPAPQTPHQGGGISNCIEKANAHAASVASCSSSSVVANGEGRGRGLTEWCGTLSVARLVAHRRRRSSP